MNIAFCSGLQKLMMLLFFRLLCGNTVSPRINVHVYLKMQLVFKTNECNYI